MEIKKISTFMAFVPIIYIFVGAIVGSVMFGIALEWILIVGAIIGGLIAISLGYKWADIEKMLADRIADGYTALLIMILIGAIVGTWMYSGTVPMIIYYGIKWLNPDFIPVTAFIVAALVSIFTGTSWGSAATSGIAFIGIAEAVGAPLPVVAGAIISGAYLGDKNSPVSDTTVLAATGAGSDLFDHIRTMLWTTVPAAIITIIVYLMLGSGTKQSGTTVAEVQQILVNLESIYNFNFILLLPAFVLFGLGFLGVPAPMAMICGSFTAMIIGMCVNGFGFIDGVTSFVSGFSPETMATLSSDVPMNETISSLLHRGGIRNAMGTVLFLICAVAFGSMLRLIGSLDRIVEILSKVISSVFNLISITWVVAFIVNSSTGNEAFSLLNVGNMFRDLYKKYDMHPSVLSSTLESGATITAPLIPITVTAVYMANTLGVPTLQYAPYAVFCYVSIILMFIFAALHKQIPQATPTIDMVGNKK